MCTQLQFSKIFVRTRKAKKEEEAKSENDEQAISKRSTTSLDDRVCKNLLQMQLTESAAAGGRFFYVRERFSIYFSVTQRFGVIATKVNFYRSEKTLTDN